jgi:glycosyltransferase involved in cell wall biosynthesis
MVHAFKVHHSEVRGGIPHVLKTLSDAFAGRWEQEIVVARLAGSGDSRLEDNGVKLTRVGSLGTLWSLPLAPTYPKVLRERLRDCDVLSVHSPFPLAEAVAGWALPADVRLVVHWHADVVRQRMLLPLLRPTTRRFLDRADRIVVSHESIVSQSSYLTDYRDKVAVIPFGIAPSQWATLNAADHAAISQLRERNPRLIAAVGRLVGYKGFDVLIRAMTAVDGQLVIVGEGPARPALERLILDLGLERKVRLVGRVSTVFVKLLLHAAKVFTLPSVSTAETFGLVQLEAMACDCPVVNTSLPTAVPWVARHNREALTVPPRQAGALATAICQLLDNPRQAEDLAASGIERVAKMFTQRRFLAETMQLYDDVWDGR